MTIPASHHHHACTCGIDHTMGSIQHPWQWQVQIAGRSAARYGDPCRCPSGHSSPIAEGAARVLIAGVPAARLSVKTLDGGVVISGEPSVLIGGETFSLPSCISIQGDAKFQAKVLADLYKIGTTKSGRMLFADMQASGKKCTICPGPAPGKRATAGSETETDPPLDRPRKLPGFGGGKDEHWTFSDPRSSDGTGIDAKIYFLPEHDDSTLFHEAIHANDMMHGTTDESPQPNPGARSAHGDKDPAPGWERRATGLPPYDELPYSQNTYNKERGYPLFKYYGFAGNK